MVDLSWHKQGMSFWIYTLPALIFLPRTQERKPWESIQLLFEEIGAISLLFKDLLDKIPLNDNHLANG